MFESEAIFKQIRHQKITGPFS